MTEEIKRLYRYTTLPVLIDLLERKKLILLDPSLHWDDKNDTSIIDAYKEKSGVSKFFALCFTHKTETIHHWKTFANGPGGCCIMFDAPRLFDIFRKYEPNLRHGIVNYRKIRDAQPDTYEIKDIPFIKRAPYQFESEYRVIWEGNWDFTFYDIDVPLDIIKRITFSQQMPEAVYESVKSFLIGKCPQLKKKINRSTIYENKTWINQFKAIN